MIVNVAAELFVTVDTLDETGTVAALPDAAMALLVAITIFGAILSAVIVPVRVGEPAKTADPVPVSSVSAVAKFAEENDPREVAFPELVTAPVKLAFVVTVAAFPVTEPAIAFVTVKSVNHPFTMRVPVLPIIPLESVANIEAAAPGAEEDVIA